MELTPLANAGNVLLPQIVADHFVRNERKVGSAAAKGGSTPKQSVIAALTWRVCLCPRLAFGSLGSRWPEGPCLEALSQKSTLFPARWRTM